MAGRYRFLMLPHCDLDTRIGCSDAFHIHPKTMANNAALLGYHSLRRHYQLFQ